MIEFDISLVKGLLNILVQLIQLIIANLKDRKVTV